LRLWCHAGVDESIVSPELNITHEKGIFICLGAHVFPSPKEIEESDDDHIGHSLVAFGEFITEGDGEDEKKDLDGNGIHSHGRIIFFTPESSIVHVLCLVVLIWM
jgi:hypothetical protein